MVPRRQRSAGPKDDGRSVGPLKGIGAWRAINVSLGKMKTRVKREGVRRWTRECKRLDGWQQR